LWRGLALPVALGLALWALDTWLRYLRAHPRTPPMPSLLKFGVAAREYARRVARASSSMLRRTLPHSVPLVVLGAGAGFFIDSFSLASYVRTYFGEDYFAGSYVDPREITLRPERPKSLVLIYVESLENTYSDPALFGHDLLARLNGLKARGVSFDDYRQMPGAHFTIAGLVATQCGLPLKSVALFGGNTQGEQVDRFLPRARCLGDILADEGYTNVFLNGSSLAFGGVGKFFRDHHYDKVVGREEWIRAGETPETMSGWGLHDDDSVRGGGRRTRRADEEAQAVQLNILRSIPITPSGICRRTVHAMGPRGFRRQSSKCTAGHVADFIEYVARERLARPRPRSSCRATIWRWATRRTKSSRAIRTAPCSTSSSAASG